MVSRAAWLLAWLAAGGACGGTPRSAAAPAALAPGLPVPRALNGRALPPPGAGALRFLLAGHLYGDIAAASAPASTFVAAGAALGASGAALMFACGDTFRGYTEPWLAPTRAALAALPMPVFNAPGNHDVTDRAAYTADCGPTWGAFVHGGCAFVQLDAELQPWEIDGPQLQFLRAALAAARRRGDVHVVFCLAHKLVFAHRQRYFEVLVGGNAIDGLTRPNRFVADVLPLLAELARDKPVYWCAGDVGCAHSLPCFFDRDPQSGVNFLATGLGDLPRDLVVEVTVTGAEVALRLRGLGGEPPGPLADYGLQAWQQRAFPRGMPAAMAALRDQLPP